MRRGAWALLILVFVVTRVGGAFLADHPEHYGSRVTDTTYDPDAVYQGWADRVVGGNEAPYSQVPIEYPPAALPFVLGPEVGKSDPTSYRTRFIWLMVAIDAAGLVGLWLISRRWGGVLGLWMWVLLVPALGPISYSRLDIIPAVATIWALERTSARGWGGSGAWLGFGTMVKLYPAFLFPAAIMVSPHKKKFLLGAATLIVLPLIPLAGSLPDLYHSVIGYHADRGIQIESLWGSGLFLAMKQGLDVSVGHSFGAFHFLGASTGAVEFVARLAALAALGLGIWLATRIAVGDVRALACVCYTTIIMLLAIGSVFSPQFMLWPVALGAVAVCVPNSPVKSSVYLLLPIALITQYIYPFLYDRLLLADSPAITVLWTRNVLMVAAAVTAFSALRQRAEVANPQPAPAEG